LSVSEDERHELFNWFEDHMGPNLARTMMPMVPPTGWGDVATRRDLDDLREATRRDLQELELRIDAKFERFRSEVLRTFGTWLFASQAAVIAVVSVLVTVLALTL
jgi:hypothetical protein